MFKPPTNPLQKLIRSFRFEGLFSSGGKMALKCGGENRRSDFVPWYLILLVCIFCMSLLLLLFISNLYLEGDDYIV